MRYNNYHRHDHLSNIFTPDTNAKMIDYVNRAIELGETNIWTTNHGSGGDIFEAKELADSNGLHAKFGMEGYIVPNPLESDGRNYHIVLIPTTNVARKKLNLASSRANMEGYYKKPRFFVSDLVNNFDKGELFITTACVAGLLKDADSFNDIFLPLLAKHGEYVFLEVQNHDDDLQREINGKALWCKGEYGIKLIHGNDSHYIYPEQSTERLELLKGKGITYSDEDSFILDYPDYDTIVERYKIQGVLSDVDIKEALDSTMDLDNVEDISIDRSIKMPTIYPELDEGEKYNLLTEKVFEGFQKVVVEDDIKDQEKYIEECKKELQVIYDTKDEIHTTDYFLLNIEVIKRAVNDYGGVLTRTGRGSCGSFILNKVLGITQIDRLTVNLPIYSDRFMSTARLLENHALPDIDMNIDRQEPFVQASRDLLGEHGCYAMIAYGTMKDSEAFRNVCRSHGLEHEKYNEVGKALEKYVDDPEWKPYIDEASKYVGTIISASIHPCAHVLLNGDIREELGVYKIGDNYCCMITSGEADAWKYLKNDYLIVTVWDIISKTFKLLGQPIITIKELVSNLDEDVWKLFDLGMTCTLNQVDGDWATSLLKKYKPRTIEEMAMFVASIRPSFESLRDDFIDRKPYTTGSKDLDEVFANTYSRCVFQENIMRYFEWLGVSPAESIGLIKKISKKKIHQEDFDALEAKIKEQWKINTGSYDGFDKSWEDMQTNMKYSFNSPHGLATGLDCLYCAWLKAKHSLEYYTVVLQLYKDDVEKTNRLIEEMKYFGITLNGVRFRHSNDSYTMDKETNSIYKSVSSIKDIGKSCGDNLYTIRDKHYDDFIDLLYDIRENKLAQKNELLKLIKIDFFREFGDIATLLIVFDVFNALNDKKTFSVDKLDEYGLTYDEVAKLCEKATAKRFSNVNMKELIRLIATKINVESITNLQRICYDLEILGYTTLLDEMTPKNMYVVSNVETNKYGSHFATLYNPRNGEQTTFKVRRAVFEEFPLTAGDLVQCIIVEQPRKVKDENGKWVDTDIMETIVKDYCLRNGWRPE